MPAPVPVAVVVLAMVCAAAAVVTLRLAALHTPHPAGGHDDDRGATGLCLVLHGTAVLCVASCITAIAEHLVPAVRVTVPAGLALWGAAAIAVGLRRVARAHPAPPPLADDDGEEDDGPGGGPGDDDPGPEPPWWPQFERELAAWQDERARPPVSA